MNSWNMLLSALNAGCGVLFILISIPLLKGKVPMNYLYGMRIGVAFRSDEDWYRVNRYGARQLIIWSALLVLAGIAALFIKFEDDSVLTWLFLFAPAITTLASCIVTHRYARTL